MVSLADKLLCKMISGRFIVTVALTSTVAYMLTNQIEIPDWFGTAYIANVILYYYKDKKEKEE